MTALLLLVALPSFTLAAYLFAETFALPERQREDTLRRAARYGRTRSALLSSRTRQERLVSALAHLALRVRPQTDLDALASQLRAAGLGQRWSSEQLLGGKVAAAGAGAGVGMLLGLAHGTLRALLPALVCAAAGALAPGFALRVRAKRRREHIAPALPDALDLLRVCVEAGLGLDGAIQKLTEHTDGPLADELELMLSEIRVGESRQTALRRLAERVDVPELTSVVRAIVQADQQGSSLGRTLAVQAADTRKKRELVAEAAANKAPVKMLFPTTFFIFPALFVVVLGPALLSIADSL